MNVVCSCCAAETDEHSQVLVSSVMPGVQFVACSFCQVMLHEPRHLVVLGVHYGDKALSMNFIAAQGKVREPGYGDKGYCGEPILANEIVPLKG